MSPGPQDADSVGGPAAAGLGFGQMASASPCEELRAPLRLLHSFAVPTVRFAEAFQRHVPCPPRTVDAASVRGALEAYFQVQPLARGYVLEEGGDLRRHVMIFVDGKAVRQRALLGDPVSPASTIDVIQALSGG